MIGQRPKVEVTVLLFIILAAIYFRFTNLNLNPAWFSDEGTQIELARQMAVGRDQYFALTQSSLLVARMPLLPWLLSLSPTLLTLRVITSVCGLLSVGLLYAVAGRRVGLLSAVLLTLYPQAIIYHRFGYSYNLLAPLLLLVIYLLSLSFQRKYVLLSAVILSLGILVDLWMLATLIPFALILLRENWRALVWAIPTALLLPLTYISWLYLQAPNNVIHDLTYTFGRVNNHSLLAQLENIQWNLIALVRQDWWMATGMIGLFFIKPLRFRLVTLAFFWIPLLYLGRNLALVSLSSHYMIPLLPLIAWGTASLLLFAHDFLQRFELPSSLIWLLFLLPFVPSTLSMVEQTQTRFVTPIDTFLLDGESVRITADFLNARINKDDIVLASPIVGSLIGGKTADFPTAISAKGNATALLPANLHTSRFAFNPQLTNADYAIIDPLWTHWGAVHMPKVADMVATIETHWTLVHEHGDIRIFAVK